MKEKEKNLLARCKVFCCKKFQEKSHDKDIGKTNKENLCKQIMEAWRAKKDMVGWILLLNIFGIGRKLRRTPFSISRAI